MISINIVVADNEASGCDDCVLGGLAGPGEESSGINIEGTTYAEVFTVVLRCSSEVGC